MSRSQSPRMAVVFSDVHVPQHDGPAVESLLEFIGAWQPDDVVIAGDFLELESCSAHGGVASPPSLVEEIDAGRQVLGALRAIAPDAKMTYLEGNHETRLARSVVARHPQLDGALTVPEQLGLADLDIAWLPEGKPLRLGNLNVIHGWWAPQYHAAKHLRETRASVMYGHTHRPQMHTFGTLTEGILQAYGLPCLRTLDPDWQKGKPGGGALGFGVVFYFEDGEFNAQMIVPPISEVG